MIVIPVQIRLVGTVINTQPARYNVVTARRLLCQAQPSRENDI